MMEWFGSWFFIVPAGCVGLLSLLYVFQDKLLYFPDVPAGYRSKILDPKDSGLPEPESHLLRMSDGVKVHVWLFVHGADSRPSRHMAEAGLRTRPTVIFYHGNAGNMSFRNDNFRALFFACGANVVAVEYRGFGLSEGSPSEELLRSDAVQVLDWLARRDDLDQSRLFVLGRSIGGAVALHLAQERPGVLAGLMLENTFTCIADLIDVLMPKLSYFKFLLRNPWRNVDVVPHLKLPCLFISSGKDELIPKGMMPRLQSLYGANKDLVESIHFPDAGHMNANQFPGYDAKIASFIHKHERK